MCRAHVPARRTWVMTLAGTPCIKHTAFSIGLKLFQNEELTRKKKGGSCFEEPRLRRAGSCGHSPRVSSGGGPGERRCQPSTSGRTLDRRGRAHRCRAEARRSPGALRAPGPCAGHEGPGSLQPRSPGQGERAPHTRRGPRPARGAPRRGRRTEDGGRSRARTSPQPEGACARGEVAGPSKTRERPAPRPRPCGSPED